MVGFGRLPIVGTGHAVAAPADPPRSYGTTPFHRGYRPAPTEDLDGVDGDFDDETEDDDYDDEATIPETPEPGVRTHFTFLVSTSPKVTRRVRSPSSDKSSSQEGTVKAETYRRLKSPRVRPHDASTAKRPSCLEGSHYSTTYHYLQI